MENSKTTIVKSTCSTSHTRIYPGDNDELICVKVYTGDWGDWDEKPQYGDPDEQESTGKILGDCNFKAR